MVLLEKGADVYVKTNLGRTSLHWSYYDSKIKICVILGKKGAVDDAEDTGTGTDTNTDY